MARITYSSGHEGGSMDATLKIERDVRLNVTITAKSDDKWDDFELRLTRHEVADLLAKLQPVKLGAFNCRKCGETNFVNVPKE